MLGIDSINNIIQVDNSPIHGKGVFSTKTIPANTRIAYFYGEEIDHDTYHSLSLDGTKIEPSGMLKYLNHSCDNNAHFIGRYLYSKRSIESGEEIAINYLDTEDIISSPFSCLCDTRNCTKEIRSRTI